MLHTRRWVQQIRSVGAPETPGPSPQRPARMYTPAELSGHHPTRPAPSCSDDEAAQLDDDDIGLLKVQFEGWTVRCVTPEEMTEALRLATDFRTTA